MLEYILNSRHKVRILRLLATRPEWIFSLSEISRELGIPKNSTGRSIKPLAEYNILREFKKGKSTVYQINRNNYIAKDMLLPLFYNEEAYPINAAREFCQKLKGKVSVGIVFGSAAKKKMQPTSDIDIALILKHPKAIEGDIEELKEKYFRDKGIILSVHTYATDEFKKRYSKKDPHISDIVGGVAVFGSIEEVI